MVSRGVPPAPPAAAEKPALVSAPSEWRPAVLTQRIRSSDDAALARRLSRAARDILSEDVALEPQPEQVVADSKQGIAR